MAFRALNVMARSFNTVPPPPAPSVVESASVLRTDDALYLTYRLQGENTNAGKATFVWRIQTPKLLSTDTNQPDGLAISADGKRLHINDTE